jgi:hypothetical protein
VVFDGEHLIGEEKIANRAATVELSKYRPMLQLGVDAGLPIQTLLNSVPPEYTKEARAAGIQGAVTLDVDIQATGVVGSNRQGRSESGFRAGREGNRVCEEMDV